MLIEGLADHGVKPQRPSWVAKTQSFAKIPFISYYMNWAICWNYIPLIILLRKIDRLSIVVWVGYNGRPNFAREAVALAPK